MALFRRKKPEVTPPPDDGDYYITNARVRSVVFKNEDAVGLAIDDLDKRVTAAIVVSPEEAISIGTTLKSYGYLAVAQRNARPKKETP